MPTEFEKKITDFIKTNELFSPADKVLLAVSGGADSTALLHTMCTLKAQSILKVELTCAHINHQLRGPDSDGDEDFVIAQANKLNLPITTRRVDVRSFARKNKLSIETAARSLRIENLLALAKQNNCNQIVTAHQKNDNAETVLQRLSRGTGFRGLGGIWPMRDFNSIRLARPLLCVTREEIIEYLNKQDLKWRVDKTNKDCSYRRNYIRHRLMPAIQKNCERPVAEQLFYLSRSAQKFYTQVSELAKKAQAASAVFAKDEIILDLKSFPTQHPAVQAEIVRQNLEMLGCGEKKLTQAHYEKILQLARQNISNKKIELPDGFIASFEYGKLFFTQTKESHPQKQAGQNVEVDVPGKTRFGNYLIKSAVFEIKEQDLEKFKAKKDKFVERFDFDKVNFPLQVRFRKAGDRFRPLGLEAEKKIGKFLTDVKVPQQIRKRTLIINDKEKIIWVWPIRISEPAKVTGETQKILQLQITQVSSTP